MDDMHANLVGKITKDIYMIKNNINQKVYIGQSINSDSRFKQHCKDKKSLIGKAIQKYGKENFSLIILEKQIENYNEKERYYIAFYNSLSPNGYNLTEGGESPPIYFGFSHPNSCINDDTLKKIVQDLSTTDLSLSKIGEKYSISKRTILGINKGERYFLNDLNYPIRKNPNLNGKINKNELENIYFLLEENYLMDREIAELYSVEYHTIQRINHGQTFYDKNKTYPIRKYKIPAKRIEPEIVDDIIDLICNTKKSLREIGRIYNKSHSIIINIKNGTSKIYSREYLSYPLRKN